MREILFRGKRKDNGEWVKGSFWDEIPGELGAIATYGSCVFHHIDLTTMGQFTGLTDKNGTKIFEGDIVNILPEVDEIGVIEWADDEAMFEVVADGWCGNFDNYLPEDLEVIANIHDNPELLEVDHG